MSPGRNTSFSQTIQYQVFVAIFVLLCSCSDNVNIENIGGNVETIGTVKKAEFVGSETCKSCHEEEFKNWDGSHHQQAMKIADSASVLGDFSKVTFVNKGITTSFFKKGNDFWVNTEGPDGKYHDYKVAYTFGVYPLQQYLIAFPKGAYQCLLTAWDAKDHKWYDLQPTLEISHDEWMHWSGGSMNWNNMCADCHSTNLHKNYNSQTKKYQTTFSEINVSCEACHGPSSLHLAHYQRPQNEKNGPKLKMTKDLSSEELVDECARCHSRRAVLTKYYDYAGEFLDYYSPALLTSPNYELDGQINGEDYVYGSFVQSKMYHNGVSCNDCHNSHTLELKKTGNDLCLSCHENKYNEAKHHFHEKGTASALCINCHMTGKTYMGNDYRRDHSFRVPRPDQSVEYGTTNACVKCHKDKSDKWASEVIIENYGEVRNDHFSDHLLAGVNGDKSALFHLISNKGYPALARATALNYYGNFKLSEGDIYQVISFLNDSSTLVRNQAVNTLRPFVFTPTVSQYLQPLLLDSIRLIRISVAKALNEQTNDYLEELDMNADFAAGQYNIAVNHEIKGRLDLAKKAYERSLIIDDYFNSSRMNLALIIYKQGDIQKAEKLYKKVIEQEPEFSTSYYMLGLLNNENGNIENALKCMELACKKDPLTYKPFYNYALLLQGQGDITRSIEVIDRGLKSFTNNEQLLYVRLSTALHMKKYTEARTTLDLLLKIAPDNTNYQQIALQLHSPR